MKKSNQKKLFLDYVIGLIHVKVICIITKPRG